jgi:hypothetical protein
MKNYLTLMNRTRCSHIIVLKFNILLWFIELNKGLSEIWIIKFNSLHSYYWRQLITGFPTYIDNFWFVIAFRILTLIDLNPWFIIAITLLNHQSLVIIFFIFNKKRAKLFPIGLMVYLITLLTRISLKISFSLNSAKIAIFI